MATVAVVSVNEYLNTSYHPDKELLEGQLVERNVGEYDRSNLQGALIAWLRQSQREWKIRVLPEQRLQVSASRFRIPDVSSPGRKRSNQDRVDDYRAFGIQNIWVLDSVKRRAYVCTHGDFREPQDETLEITGSPIRIALRDLFSDLD